MKLLRLFACKHPAAALAVERDATVEPIDADFDRVTYHLLCRACGAPVEVTYASMRGGYQAFMRRGGGA